MAEVKSAQADSFVQRPDPAYSVFLLYGPDAGLVSERASVLSGNFGVDTKDSMAVLRLDADAACAEPGRLVDETRSIGMFGGKRILRISGSTRRNLADAVRPVLEFHSDECRLIIEAGDLKKDSALRRLVERSSVGVAVPCFPDGERELDNLISLELQAARLAIDTDARQLLKASLGSDRRLSRAEISKLALYSHGQARITIADVEAIVGDSSAAELDEVVDSAVSGKIENLEAELARVLARSSAELPLIWAMRHFQMLQLARFRMDRHGATAEAVVAAIRPPVNFKRRPAILQGLRIWNVASITRALARLDEAILEARSNSGLAASLCGATLLAICNQARRSNLKN
jgi:DNA polymerase III subunit delta